MLVVLDALNIMLSPSGADPTSATPIAVGSIPNTAGPLALISLTLMILIGGRRRRTSL